MSEDIVQRGVNHPIPASYLGRTLTSNNLGARVDVASRCRPVQLEENTGVGSRVCAGEGDKCAAGVDGFATTRDVDLRAGNVELGTSGAAGRVEGDVLNSEEILAVSNTLGDSGGDLFLACSGRRIRNVCWSS